MSFLSDNDYGSPSPYPPSSSPSDSDVDHSIPRITSILRTSITSVSEAHLRAIMIKLADNDPHFQHAIMNELSNLAAFDTPPVAPITPTPRGKTYRRVPRHRKPSVRNSKPVDYNSPPQEENAVIGKTIYHPGHLEDELFEIFTVTPHGQASKAIRKITMWSCCDEDEWCPGCTSVSAFKLWAL